MMDDCREKLFLVIFSFLLCIVLWLKERYVSMFQS